MMIAKSCVESVFVVVCIQISRRNYPAGYLERYLIDQCQTMLRMNDLFSCQFSVTDFHNTIRFFSNAIIMRNKDKRCVKLLVNLAE